jgi:iron complex outermembrane recepter protein
MKLSSIQNRIVPYEARCRPLARLLLVALLQLLAASASAAQQHFSIPAGVLADALDRFSEQSGLQTVHASPRIQDLQTSRVEGDYSPAAVLDLLLEGSGLAWQQVDEHTILVGPPSRSPRTSPRLGPLFSDDPEATPGLSDIQVFANTRRMLPNDPGISTFGFNKALLETPRSLTVISDSTIELYSLSAVEDLLRVAPSVYTPTRFGIQGAVDIRNMSADTYVRGMKRLNLQGHGRSVLGAADSIEIVRGPPSPLYGMGKIGGYTNVVPKSGRARVGGYLDSVQGFSQLILGEYGRSELSLGIGGPLDLGSKHGGYYLYSLLEDSDTWINNVGIGQTVLQGAITLDDVVGGIRLETGIDYQRSRTSGALVNRVNQDMIDNNRYIGGQPLANLDANGNGAIGFLEMHRNSPVAGQLATNNQPLIQVWSWPLDAQGLPLPLSGFPTISGIPQTLYDYLQQHPQADPTGLLRAQGVGGPLPMSGQVPIGFALDPRTVGYAELDPRRAGAFEREVEANFLMGYVDLIHDQNPDFTVKNQLFFDSMDQYKLSEQPGGGKQDVQVFENKLTLTRRFGALPRWLQAEALVSANLRNTRASGYRYVGDQGSNRTDASFGSGAMLPNTTFVHPFDNPVLEADGAPWFSRYLTQYWEAGLGVLLDVNLGAHTSVLVGARHDRSRAKNTDYAGTLDPFSGTALAPGAWRTQDSRARGYDADSSWHLSLSQQLPFKLRPYLTLAAASLTLESNNNRMTNNVIQQGHIGKAQLQEAGIKGSAQNGRLFYTLARYQQRRTDINEANFAALQSASASATSTRGWEAELKWAPTDTLFISLYAVDQETRFVPNAGENILVDARTLGFVDIQDDAGNIVFPAEAFLYGGRSFLVLPAGMADFGIKQGTPERQYGLLLQWQMTPLLGFTLSSNHFSGMYSGRLQQVRLPSSDIINAGLSLDRGNWHFRFDLNNLFNERYFRPRTGENLGETLISTMPGRNWLAMFRIDL